VKLRLKNTSELIVHGPLKARVTAMKSDLGVARIAGADPGGVGTIVDLTAEVKDGQLKPGEQSADKTLTFEFTDLRPFKQGEALKTGLVELDLRVYAAPAAKP
jgi:hypothetical protein